MPTVGGFNGFREAFFVVVEMCRGHKSVLGQFARTAVLVNGWQAVLFAGPSCHPIRQAVYFSRTLHTRGGFCIFPPSFGWNTPHPR